MSKEIFSFSRLGTYVTCPYSYYLTYIEKRPRKDNIYGDLGKVCHDLCENLQHKKISNEQAVETWEMEVDRALDLYPFPTRNSQITYVDCVKEYLKAFEPFECDSYATEEHFTVDVCGATLQGYIDLYYIKGDELHVVDYKTSTKFSKKSLINSKQYQLILYALYLREKFPKHKIFLHFDMCKYTINKRGTFKERDENENMGRALVTVPFSEENIMATKKYISDTVNDITIDKMFGEEVFIKRPDYNFCVRLCNHYEECKPKFEFKSKLKKGE